MLLPEFSGTAGFHSWAEAGGFDEKFFLLCRWYRILDDVGTTVRQFEGYIHIPRLNP